MPDSSGRLFLYEALELRSEYTARIKTLRDLMPQSRRSRDLFAYSRTEEAKLRPASGFDPAKAREELRSMEKRQRLLNAAIQQANFEHNIEHAGETLRLTEALEVRKATNDRLAELHNQLVQSAYERVIYKEDRDIVEEPDVAYSEARAELDAARREFRQLNRALRAASFEVTVDFRDE